MIAASPADDYVNERFPNLKKYTFFRVVRSSVPSASHYAPHDHVGVPGEGLVVSLHAPLFVDTLHEKVPCQLGLVSVSSTREWHRTVLCHSHKKICLTDCSITFHLKTSLTQEAASVAELQVLP